MMTLPSFYLLLKSLCGVQVGMNMKTYWHCIYCKVKQWIQRELSHTIKSRCACVWNIWWLILILLCSLKTNLSFETWKHLLESRGYLIHLSLFSGGHLSTYCFRYLGHLSIFSQLFFLFSLFS